MEIQKIQLSRLHEDPLNLRQHGKENIEMLKKSLRDYHQYRPLIVDKNTMAVKIGNGRFMAMKALGWTEADCILVDFESHEGMEVIDNRLNELSEWNDADIDEWLMNEKGVDWWGCDLKKSLELLEKAKKEEQTQLSEEGEKPKKPRQKREKKEHLCPCCGKPLHRVKPIIL